MIQSSRLRGLLLFLLLLTLAAPLAACGKKGNLDAPEPDRYPRQYPDPSYQ